MNTRFLIPTLGFIFLSLLVISCNRDEKQATASIEGDWNVTAITSQYGNFTNNAFDPTDEISESGELGTFKFKESTVDFSFTRNDTLYTGNESWTLVAEKVNSGFTRVTEFSLTIDNQFDFKVFFEDQTKNSEKNAQNATFLETPSSGFGVSIDISLEKVD